MNISIAIKNKAFYSDLKEIGYTGVDFSMVIYDNMTETILSDAYTEEIMAQYRLLSQAGLEVSQSHMTFWPGHFEPFSDPEEYAKHFAPLYSRQIELTRMIHCPTAVVHLYLDEDEEKSRRGNIALIKELLPVLEKNNVILSIENLYGPGFTDGHLTSAEDLLFYMDYFKSPYLGICLDVGHAIALYQDPVAILRKVQNHLTALHIHTSHPNQDLHALPGFLGYSEKIDWNEFYNVLSETNYKGTFNLELAQPSHLSHEAMVTYFKLAYQVAEEIVNKK